MKHTDPLNDQSSQQFRHLMEEFTPDQQIQSALKNAAREAVNQTPKTTWQLQPVFTLGATALLAITLTFGLGLFPDSPQTGHPTDQMAQQNVHPVNADDFEMLAEGDALELYQELEFYQWLELGGDAEAA